MKLEMDNQSLGKGTRNFATGYSLHQTPRIYLLLGVDLLVVGNGFKRRMSTLVKVLYGVNGQASSEWDLP